MSRETDWARLIEKGLRSYLLSVCSPLLGIQDRGTIPKGEYAMSMCLDKLRKLRNHIGASPSRQLLRQGFLPA